MMRRGNQCRPLNIIVLCGFCLYAAFLLISVGGGIDRKYQWDFKSHYCAARVQEMGLNFYDEPFLRHFCSPDVSQYYSYMPLSIWFFRFFSLFPYPTAYSLFFLLKILALAGVFVIWVKTFLKKESDLGFYAFSLLAFNGALFLDLRAGNVNLLEQLGLWLGFYFLLKKKLVLFGICVILVATFKVVPLAFLALLLLTREKKKVLYFCGSLLAFVAIHGISFAVNPVAFKEFLRVFFSMLREEKTITNPSIYAFLQDAVNSAHSSVFGEAAPRLLVFSLFGVLAALIVFLTWKGLARLRENPGYDSEKTMIFLFCLAFALTAPRFKDYSYILLLVPAYFALKKYAAGLGSAFLFALAVLSLAEHTSLPGFEVVFRYVWRYFPMFTAVAFWVLYLRHAYRPEEISLPSSLPARRDEIFRPARTPENCGRRRDSALRRWFS